MLWSFTLMLVLALVLLIPILAIVLDSGVGRALASRLERDRIPSGADTSGEKLHYLEAEVERLSGEVHRLTEESDFLHKLLTEGSDGGGADPKLPPGERPG